jgi:sugar/nucleoside kinase (ribokinase family)
VESLTRPPPTLAVLGSLTLDEIVSKGETRVAPGGSALYVSVSSSLLGAKVDIISHVGVDYPSESLEWLENRGIGVERVKRLEGRTCRFRLQYRRGSRTLQLLQIGSQLETSEVNGSWNAIHIGPVFHEVPLTLVSECRRHSNLVSMDLQGFIRRQDKGGRVLLRRTRFGNSLQSVDLVKVTVAEAWAQAGASDLFSAIGRILQLGPKYLVVTMGSKGSILAERGGTLSRIPAYPETSVVDPTGAGDAMVGGWLATYTATRDPLWATSVGAALSSLLVRRGGLAKFRVPRKELFRRSAWVYTRVRN